jgi:hypothetical protein
MSSVDSIAATAQTLQLRDGRTLGTLTTASQKGKRCSTFIGSSRDTHRNKQETMAC